MNNFSTHSDAILCFLSRAVFFASAFFKPPFHNLLFPIFSVSLLSSFSGPIAPRGGRRQQQAPVEVAPIFAEILQE
jgi:hypothetical protein